MANKKYVKIILKKEMFIRGELHLHLLQHSTKEETRKYNKSLWSFIYHLCLLTL